MVESLMDRKDPSPRVLSPSVGKSPHAAATVCEAASAAREIRAAVSGWHPKSLPCIFPPCAPHGVVKADHEQIDMIVGTRHGGDLLRGVVEHGFGMDLKSRRPARARLPPCAPHSVVEADHEQVDVILGARHGGDLLSGVVEHGF